MHRKAVCPTDVSVQELLLREDREKVPQLWLPCQGCCIVVLAAGLVQGECFLWTLTEPLSLSHRQQKKGKLLANAHHSGRRERLSGHFP